MFPDPVSRFFPPILMASSMLLGDEEDRRRRYREISRDDIGSATRQRELFFRVLSREGKRTRLKKKKKKSSDTPAIFPHKNSFFSTFVSFSLFFPLPSFLRDGLDDLRIRTRRPRDGHQPPERHGAPFLLERGEICPGRRPSISPLWRRRRPRRARAAADAASVSSTLLTLSICRSG